MVCSVLFGWFSFLSVPMMRLLLNAVPNSSISVLEKMQKNLGSPENVSGSLKAQERKRNCYH